jgi:hypothetical protein
MLDTREWNWILFALLYSHCASGNYDRDLRRKLIRSSHHSCLTNRGMYFITQMGFLNYNLAISLRRR